VRKPARPKHKWEVVVTKTGCEGVYLADDENGKFYDQLSNCQLLYMTALSAVGVVLAD
jgi:hypothetical protein